jgi:hypothetical protein
MWLLSNGAVNEPATMIVCDNAVELPGLVLTLADELDVEPDTILVQKIG